MRRGRLRMGARGAATLCASAHRRIAGRDRAASAGAGAGAPPGTAAVPSRAIAARSLRAGLARDRAVGGGSA